MSKKLTGLMLRTLIGAAIFTVVVFVAGIAAGWLGAHGTVNTDHAVVWLSGAIAVVSMTGAMVISVAWMRAIDEAAREAHKAAWFWGGCGGMALGGVALIMAALPQSAEWTFPAVGGRSDPAAYAATGAFGMMVLMVAGYSVVWAWWWLTRLRD
ncbi:MAG: hypothetical protein ACK4JY_14430 [Brevundimonas sp.]|uniref:hypothetical protein n=1 Tax=Brevundimonas sp. TaxID=1871086 RepID=UPI00391CF262